jgi:NADH-quinone oxidoreductase subunit C
MTQPYPVKDLATTLAEQFPGAAEEVGNSLLVRPASLLKVMAYLKETPELDFAYLNYITAVDYYSYFEIVYQLTSLAHNHTIIVKTRCPGRNNLSVPSVTGLWQGADYQEREIYDLMGIGFKGHPNLKRLFLWDGFPGHPLRKDFQP